MISLRLASRPAATPPPAQRRWQRVSVCLPAELLSLEGERSALVINLCSRGAMVEIPLPPAVGSEVLLYCGAIAAEGEIVWQRPRHCGIRFHTPVDEQDVDSEARCSRISFDQLLAR